jgi:hypothetical protein
VTVLRLWNSLLLLTIGGDQKLAQAPLRMDPTISRRFPRPNHARRSKPV